MLNEFNKTNGELASLTQANPSSIQNCYQVGPLWGGLASRQIKLSYPT